jgi:uncharacterized protein (TIGR02246 family)
VVVTERSRDDLERARAKWWATVSTGDLDGYLSLFAEDAVWVTPELDEIVGRPAIRAWLEPVFAQFDYELTITVADVRIAGNLGIERARFLSRMTPKPPTFRAAPGFADPHATEGGSVPHLAAVPDEPDAEPVAVEGSATDSEALVEGEAWGEDAAENPVIPDVPRRLADHDDVGSLFSEDESRFEVEAEESDAVGDDEGSDGADFDDDGRPELLIVAEDDALDAQADPDDDLGLDADVEAPLHPRGPGADGDEPHEGRYLMYWRWHDGAGWLVHRYADVTGVA